VLLFQVYPRADADGIKTLEIRMSQRSMDTVEGPRVDRQDVKDSIVNDVPSFRPSCMQRARAADPIRTARRIVRREDRSLPASHHFPTRIVMG
jgi:hypothetical protein